MKTSILLITMLLAACSSTINSSQIYRAEEACKDHKGQSEILSVSLFNLIDLPRLNMVRCIDGTTYNIGNIK